MKSVEEQLTATLHDRAEGEVDTGALLAGASSRGRQLRRRYRIAATTAAAAGVAAVMAITTAAIGTLPGGAPPGVGRVPERGATSAPAGWTTLPRPPAATGEPTAVDDPSVVGAAGGLVHLSFDRLPSPYDRVQYLSWNGLEYVDLRPARSGPDADYQNFVTVFLVNDERQLNEREGGTPVTVGGKPARLYADENGGSAVRWQPAPGLWLEAMTSPGEQPPTPPTKGSMSPQLRAVAEAVRVDRVARCVTPARLGHVPEGVKYDSCHITFTDGGDPRASLRLKRNDGAELEVSVPAPAEIEDRKPDLTVAGAPAIWSGDEGGGGGTLIVYGLQGLDVAVSARHGFTRKDAIAVAEGLRLAKNLKDPATWPTHPFD